MTLPTTPARRIWFLLSLSLLLVSLGLGGGCSKDEPLLHATNEAPRIDSLSAAPETLSLGAISDLSCVASDGDNDILRYEWVAEKGVFLGTIHDRPTIRWQAPADEEGMVRITVTATDEEEEDSQSIDIFVIGEPGSLEGLVTAQSDGSALQGAVVSLEGFSATTDENGAYRIESITEGSYAVTASLDGYVSSQTTFEVKSGENDLNFVLAAVGEVGRIAGTVTNSLGSPVEGATCAVPILDLTTETDASGSYAFESIPNGSYNVSISKAGYFPVLDLVEVASDDVSFSAELDAEVIDPPLDLFASRDDGTTVTLSWTSPDLETLAGVRLFVRQEDEPSEALFDDPLPATQSSYEFTGELHTRYRFRIQTVNVEDEWSDTGLLSNTVVLSPPSALVSVPAGSVTMGATPDGEAEDWGPTDGHPGNPVAVEAFSIEATEVSNRQYYALMTELVSTAEVQVVSSGVWMGDSRLLNTSASKIKWNGDTNRFTVESGFEDHPVVGVTWLGATIYAERFARRLPSEAEWERAARGSTADSGTFESSGVGYGTKYPWGNDVPTPSLANWDDGAGNAGTVEVTALPAGSTAHWGDPVYNMAGNVWEWCDDWIGPFVSPHSPPASGIQRVVRGGSWADDIDYLRVGARFSTAPETGAPAVGFRCAAE